MSRRAFTLVETLMALTLTAILATGAAMLVVEITREWARRETGPAFRRHVGGLGGLLEKALADTRRAGSGAGALWEIPPGAPPTTPPALHLVLPDLAMVADVPAGTTPAGEGWLVVEKEAGLLLLWRTHREKRLDATATHRLVLSPWCESMVAAQYAPGVDRWTEFSPASPAPIGEVHRRVTLHLRRYGESADITLSPDPPAADAPAY